MSFDINWEVIKITKGLYLSEKVQCDTVIL